jgi:hypothetical protein
MLAIWHPFWYESDRSISEGEVGDFEFFELPPPYVKSEGLPVFWHSGRSAEPYHRVYREHLRILKIRHPELGQIQSIDTDDLDYKVTMTDGRVAMINAEEQPGTVYFLKPSRSEDSGSPFEAPLKVQDWTFYVETEKV